MIEYFKCRYLFTKQFQLDMILSIDSWQIDVCELFPRLRARIIAWHITKERLNICGSFSSSSDFSFIHQPWKHFLTHILQRKPLTSHSNRKKRKKLSKLLIEMVFRNILRAVNCHTRTHFNVYLQNVFFFSFVSFDVEGTADSRLLSAQHLTEVSSRWIAFANFSWNSLDLN